MYHHMIKYYFILNLKSTNYMMIHIKYVLIRIFKIGMYNFIVYFGTPFIKKRMVFSALMIINISFVSKQSKYPH